MLGIINFKIFKILKMLGIINETPSHLTVLPLGHDLSRIKDSVLRLNLVSHCQWSISKSIIYVRDRHDREKYSHDSHDSAEQINKKN